MIRVSDKQVCDRCGVSRNNFHRLSPTLRLCNWCYVRMPSTACTDCGKSIRNVEEKPEPRCSTCQMKSDAASQHCPRCNRSLQGIRLARLKDGRYCCRRCFEILTYVRACYYCGRESPYAYRCLVLGFDHPACSRCRNRHPSNGICSGCRYPRPRAGIGSDGKPYCAKCLPQEGRPPVTCARCGDVKPAGTKAYCVDCAWALIHERLLGKLSPAIGTDWARDLFAAYHHEEMNRVREGQWQLALRRDLPFFQALAHHFTSPDDLSGVLIVRRLGWPLVRAHRRAVSFLAAKGLVILDDDPDYLLEISISRLGEIIPAEPVWIHDLLVRFKTYLLRMRDRVVNKRARCRIPVQPKSFEAIIREALAFLRFAASAHGVNSVQGLTQDILNQYLGNGGKNLAIRALIRYMHNNERAFHRLRVPKVPIGCGFQFILSEKRRQAIIDACSAAKTTLEYRWSFATLLGLVYAQDPRRALRMRMSQIRVDDDVISMRFAREWIRLDDLTARIAGEWLRRRRGCTPADTEGTSAYIFPGRRATTGLGLGAFAKRNRQLGFGSRHLRATAVSTLIRNGLMQPRVLADCFGLEIHYSTKWVLGLGGRLQQASRHLVDQYVR